MIHTVGIAVFECKISRLLVTGETDRPAKVLLDQRQRGGRLEGRQLVLKLRQRLQVGFWQQVRPRRQRLPHLHAVQT